MSNVPRHPRAHRARCVVAAAVLALLLAVFAVPGTAFAHAELESSNPSAGEVLDEAPASLLLTFTEPVEINLGGVRLFDGSGRAVAIGEARHRSGHDDEVEVSLPELGNGSYVVDWRVVSADSHPVQGAFTFQVGERSNLQPGVLADIVSSSHTSKAASVGLGITRGVVIGAIAIVFGGLIAVGLGMVGMSRRIRVVVGIGVVAGTVAGLLQLPLEVGFATGRGLGAITDADSWSIGFDSRVGLAWVVRALIIGAVGGALLILAADHRRTWWRAAALIGLVGTGVASAYGGHGNTGRWIPLGVAMTVLHVAAMAVWLGGLVVLLLDFRNVGHEGWRRFSRVALATIAVVVASGSVQSVRQLSSLGELTDTSNSYAQVLVRKLVVVVILLALAFVSRRIVHRRELDDARLRRSVAIEVLAAIGIVVFTSLLMASNPTAATGSRPVSVSLVQGDYFASILIEPARTGPNEMHVYLRSTSSLIEADEVIVEISDPTRQVNALRIPVEFSGAGHYTTSAATFPYSATWTVTVTARYGFDEVTFTTDVDIR